MYITILHARNIHLHRYHKYCSNIRTNDTNCRNTSRCGSSSYGHLNMSVVNMMGARSGVLKCTWSHFHSNVRGINGENTWTAWGYKIGICRGKGN